MSPALNDREINNIYKSLDELHVKIDSLNEWRWRVVGMSASVSAIVGTCVSMIGLFL
jgi:hypothetical protein